MPTLKISKACATSKNPEESACSHTPNFAVKWTPCGINSGRAASPTRWMPLSSLRNLKEGIFPDLRKLGAAGSDSPPLRELKGFERLTLQPGETRTFTFSLGPAELGYWSTSLGQWVQDAEAFDVWVGAGSSATLHSELTVVRGERGTRCVARERSSGCPKRRAQRVFDAIDGTYCSAAPLPVAVVNAKNGLFGQPHYLCQHTEEDGTPPA